VIRLIIPLVAVVGALTLIWIIRHDDGVKSRRKLSKENTEMHGLIEVIYLAAATAQPFEPNLADMVLGTIRAHDLFRDDPRYKELN
jgi:hypothetical protein